MDSVWTLPLEEEEKMKSILLSANEDGGFEARLQAALDVARASDGHVTCLQARPFNSFVVSDPFGGVYAPAALIERLETADNAHQEAIEARLKTEGVSWDWLREDGETGRALVARSSLADLIVVNLPGDDAAAMAVASDVALHARSAVLAVPRSGGRFDPAGKAMVAWNGSNESAHALRLAMPLLRMAAAVEIVTISAEAGRFPQLDASRYLARHGIMSELVERPAEGRRNADALIDAAGATGAGSIVMGAYGHTRMREAVLGGTTRDLLRRSPLPLILAH
jgi:nucleotide-binding universal stress UspA family protein